MKKSNLKILIIRFSSIGDIVLTTPVIRCLKKQLPGVELHYLTKKSFEPILAGNPYLDKIHFLKASLRETIAEMQSQKFDLIIDLHRNLRTLIIKTALGRPAYSFNKLNWQKWLLVVFKKNLMPPVHIVDRYVKTVEPLGVTNDQKGLDYFLTKEYSLTDMLPASHQRYVAIVIGGQHATKRLPTESLSKICRLNSSPIVLLGGPEDEVQAKRIALAAGTHVFNACGNFSIDESAFLIKMATRVLTHDTGLMHIAAAFNKPLISVWGNTVPEFGMYPYRVAESHIIEIEGLSCRPCSKIGFSKCPKGHFKCMAEIDLIELSKKVYE